MSSLTVVEASKRKSGNTLLDLIVEHIAASAGIMGVLPISEIVGNSISYNREGALPSVSFRGVNEDPTATSGTLDPQTAALKILSATCNVDRFILKTMGADQLAAQIQMHAKSMALTFERTVIKGDKDTNAKEFDGLQNLVTGDNLLSNSAASSGGDALSLADFDRSFDQCFDPTDILMGEGMKRRFDQAARSSTLTNNSVATTYNSELGRNVTTYKGIPITVIGRDETDSHILDFNEANVGGGSNVGTSIYVGNFSALGVHGIQNGGIEVDLRTKNENKVASHALIEWYVGLVMKHQRACVRYYSVKDAAIVA